MIKEEEERKRIRIRSKNKNKYSSDDDDHDVFREKIKSRTKDNLALKGSGMPIVFIVEVLRD